MSYREYIVMIDSDLISLEKRHICSLIEPIKTKKAQVTLSMRENSLTLCQWLGADFLSGDRVLPLSLLDDENFLEKAHGYGLEVLLNEKIIQNHLRVTSVYFDGVNNERKYSKLNSYLRGTFADWIMTRDIIRDIGRGNFWYGLPGFFYQLWYFSRFSAKIEGTVDREN